MATAAELWVLDSFNQIAIGINHVDSARDADGTALRVDKDLRISHVKNLLFNRGNRVVIASVMGGATSTSSLIQSDGYVRE